ncbi:MAG TPA: dynamin family protein [Dermatophilaceae bacterium]|nr:dynamin family protein [Dermatophilaceae bacterium]
MSPLKMGPAAGKTSSGSASNGMTELSAESVREMAAALAAALESGGGCLPAGEVERAHVVIEKAAARTSVAGGHTVVALAGASGSGKSSLFNALIGADVAKIGARRPTTATPTAAVWGSESASALLDWLKVGARHIVTEKPSGATGSGADSHDTAATPPSTPPAPGRDLDGLVLLDLPDFDSHETTHRLEVDRLLDLVDVFVWVTDPQKYADARLHEDYITRLSAHEAVTIVVLNQADLLTPGTLGACRNDLLQLLGADGVVDAEVIATSAREGSGVVDLRHRISQAVMGQNAAVQRLRSDLRSVATVLRSSVADSEPRLDDSAGANLVDALTRAAGIPVILDAVERDYRRETWARTGWPFTRWARALRPAPLKRLRLNSGAPVPSGAFSESDIRSVLGRSSLPPATPAARSAVDLATREVGDRAGRGLPQAWADAVADAATPPGEDLGDALDQAVGSTPLRARNPLWWAIFGQLQWILALAAALGLLWLVILMVLGWLQLRVDPPRLGPLPYPLLLLAGSLLTGFLMSLLTRSIGRVGGRRRKALVAAHLRASVAQVARDRLVAPVQEVLDRHRMTREHLEAARRRV